MLTLSLAEHRAAPDDSWVATVNIKKRESDLKFHKTLHGESFPVVKILTRKDNPNAPRFI